MSEERDDGNLPVEDQPELDDLEVEEGEEEDEGESPVEDGGEPEVESGQQQPAAQPARRGRGARERQRAELRELRERLERNERELQGYRQQQASPRADNSAELARIAAYERDQLPLLSPHEISAYYAQKTERTLGAALSQFQQRTADSIDRTSWDAACRSDPIKARLSAEVERVRLDEAREGRFPSRDTIFTFLYGQEALRGRNRQTASQRAAAQRRVRAQTTRPGAARSDVGRERSTARDQDSYEGAMERMEERKRRGDPLW
jgi:hypothetical protein